MMFVENETRESIFVVFNAQRPKSASGNQFLVDLLNVQAKNDKRPRIFSRLWTKIGFWPWTWNLRGQAVAKVLCTYASRFSGFQVFRFLGFPVFRFSVLTRQGFPVFRFLGF
jgi:hypothetical protein